MGRRIASGREGRGSRIVRHPQTGRRGDSAAGSFGRARGCGGSGSPWIRFCLGLTAQLDAKIAIAGLRLR